MPTELAKISPVIWVMVPLPALLKRSLPGLARA
jgi:hypothetical protein